MCDLLSIHSRMSPKALYFCCHRLLCFHLVFSPSSAMFILDSSFPTPVFSSATQIFTTSNNQFLCSPALLADPNLLNVYFSSMMTLPRLAAIYSERCLRAKILISTRKKMTLHWKPLGHTYNSSMNSF